jgi:hypothetical protein
MNRAGLRLGHVARTFEKCCTLPLIVIRPLKGQCHEIFHLFFHKKNHTWGPVKFLKIVSNLALTSQSYSRISKESPLHYIVVSHDSVLYYVAASQNSRYIT